MIWRPTKLQIINSKLVYEEEKSFEEGAGKLSFTDFDMTVLNLQSGYKKEKVNDLLSRALRINPSDKNLPDFINFINFLSKNNELVISKFLCERALSLNNHVIYFLYSQIQRKISNQKVALNYLIKAIIFEYIY